MAYAPGRVNLIGEHIDYHNLPVLPIALDRGICLAFRPRRDSEVFALSAATPLQPVSFSLPNVLLSKGNPGDWGNYVKAAALVAHDHFGATQGIEAAIVSDLPVAAGLSSSSALLVACTLALLAANNLQPSLSRLMSVLPEGEQFVGTRGGGMDQAVILASHKGHALSIHFHPFAVSHVPIPEDWRFLIADSLHAAEKSSALVNEYNRRRQAGADALAALNFASYQEVLAAESAVLPSRLTDREQRNAFRHVVSEALRVERAVAALQISDLQTFGTLLNESHCSLRDRLLVSTPAIDALVDTAMAAGAAGARITGAGFGGCIVAACHRDTVNNVRDTLKLRHFAELAPADLQKHLFVANPAAGALEILNA